MAQLSLAPERTGYRKSELTRLAFPDVLLSARSLASSQTLSAMGVLGVVQTSLDQLGLPRDRDFVELKRRVLEEVSAGRLENAVNLAILHAAAAASDAALAASKNSD